MSEKLKIVYRPLQELSPYAHNARTHSTEQVAQLVESIKQFGWTNPVLIDEKGEIIAGLWSNRSGMIRGSLIKNLAMITRMMPEVISSLSNSLLSNRPEESHHFGFNYG